MEDRNFSEILEIVRTIDRQIRAGLDNVYVYFSWGVSKRIATTYKGMPTLLLRVSGLYHKGCVLISYNEGADLYEVYFTTLKYNVKKEFKRVYAEELGNLIDRVVERGYTDEETYLLRANKDTQRKFNRK